MKKMFGLIVVAAFALLFSCEEERVILYEKHISCDGAYEVEIPADIKRTHHIADFMAFIDEEKNFIIDLQQVQEEAPLISVVEKKTIDTYDYNLFQSSDSTMFYRVTRGDNMWCAYDLYMDKIVNDKIYKIHVCSDILGKSYLVEVIEHIYSSLQPNEFQQ